MITHITIVGEMIQRKNHEWLIDYMIERKDNKDIRLTLIGGGILFDRLKAKAADDKRIVFTGKMPRGEVVEHLRRSDIFVMPSYNESFGLVYLEAAATYNAIICMANEGIYGVVRSLFVRNKRDMFVRLDRLVRDRKMIKTLARYAYEDVMALTWENISKKYHNLYKGILK